MSGEKKHYAKLFSTISINPIECDIRNMNIERT